MNKPHTQCIVKSLGSVFVIATAICLCSTATATSEHLIAGAALAPETTQQTASHQSSALITVAAQAGVIKAVAIKAETQNAATTKTNQTSPSDLLSANSCLNQLADDDQVVITAAFHDGTGGFGQLKELITRKPWGEVGIKIQNQLDKLIDELSPFLIVKLNKKQALTLDTHRDLIKWILVQSTDKVCN